MIGNDSNANDSLFRRDDARFRPEVAMSGRCGISPAGQLRLTEEARIGLRLPLTLWFGDCSPADARLNQLHRQRIDFLAQLERKGGGRLAEWSVIGMASSEGRHMLGFLVQDLRDIRGALGSSLMQRRKSARLNSRLEWQ